MQGQTRNYVIATLVAAPATAALTTLANVKDDLGLKTTDTSNDAKLTRYIAEESASIARYCNRIFGLAIWQDEFRPPRGVWGEGTRAATNPLKLTHYPLAAAAVSFVGNTHLSKVVDGIASTASLVEGTPIFGSGLNLSDGTLAAAGIPAGATIETVNPNSILLSAPVTVAANGGQLVAGLQVVETLANVSTQLIAGTDFQIERGSLLPGDEGAAQLYRLNDQNNPRNWPAAKIVVTYQAGYVLPSDDATEIIGAPMPTDLEGACLRVVIGRFLARSRDPLLVERAQPQALGTERYWVGAMPGQRGPYPNDIMNVLDGYRVPVVA